MLILRYHSMWLYSCNFILKISVYTFWSNHKRCFRVWLTVNDGKWKKLCVCIQCCWVCLITAFGVDMMSALWHSNGTKYMLDVLFVSANMQSYAVIFTTVLTNRVLVWYCRVMVSRVSAMVGFCLALTKYHCEFDNLNCIICHGCVYSI